MTSYKVVCFAGSMRSKSCNEGLLRYMVAAASKSAPQLSLEMLEEVKEFPLFNQDLIDQGKVPEPVVKAWQRVSEAQAVIIATPEYNLSMAPATTNAVAWLSKSIFTDDDKKNLPAPLRGKPLGIVSAGGNMGGGRATLHARSSFPVFLGMPVMLQPDLAVRIFHSNPMPFNMETGDLTDPTTMAQADAYLTKFQEWVSRNAVEKK